MIHYGSCGDGQQAPFLFPLRKLTAHSAVYPKNRSRKNGQETIPFPNLFLVPRELGERHGLLGAGAEAVFVKSRPPRLAGGEFVGFHSINPIHQAALPKVIPTVIAATIVKAVSARKLSKIEVSGFTVLLAIYFPLFDHAGDIAPLYNKSKREDFPISKPRRGAVLCPHVQDR